MYKLIVGIVLGAVLMYLFDPRQGGERRHTLAERMRQGREELPAEAQHAQDRFADARERARSTFQEARDRVQSTVTHARDRTDSEMGAEDAAGEATGESPS